MDLLNKIARFFRIRNHSPKEAKPVLKILKEWGILYDKIELRQEEFISKSWIPGWFSSLLDPFPPLGNRVPFKDPGLSITIDRSKNPHLDPKFWTDALELDFIKEIEAKTEYRYYEHYYWILDQDRSDSLHYKKLVICLRPEANREESRYDYLDKAMESDNVIEISDNLDDIFNLGWCHTPFEFKRNWGAFQGEVYHSYYGYPIYKKITKKLLIYTL
jgi:hypothetical protein